MVLCIVKASKVSSQLMLLTKVSLSPKQRNLFTFDDWEIYINTASATIHF